MLRHMWHPHLSVLAGLAPSRVGASVNHTQRDGPRAAMVMGAC